MKPKRIKQTRTTTKPPRPTLAQDLAAFRARKGATQAVLAGQLWNMPRRTYQDIEAGRRRPPPWVQLAILDRIERLGGTED